MVSQNGIFISLNYYENIVEDDDRSITVYLKTASLQFLVFRIKSKRLFCWCLEFLTPYWLRA